MVGRRRTERPAGRPDPARARVLNPMALGRSNQGIADELIATVPAIERPVTSIFNRLGRRQAPEGHRRVLAVLEYLKRS